MCNQNLPKVPKNGLFFTYISLNIGHSDLLFGLKVDLLNTNKDYHIERLCDHKRPNVTPKSSKNDLYFLSK